MIVTLSRATSRERPLQAAVNALRVAVERPMSGCADFTIYFNDKERLWKATVARAFGELQAGLAEAVQPGNGADGTDTLAALDRSLRQFVRFVARHPEFMRLMNDESKRDSRRMRWLADHFVGPLSQAMSAQFERAQAEGLVARISPVSLRYIVLGAAGLVFSQAPECRYVTGVDPTDPEFAERHADALVQLLTGRATLPGRRRSRGGAMPPRRSR